MATATKKKPFFSKSTKEKQNAETPKATGEVLKQPDERPVPGANALKQTEKSFQAFTIQRKHDGVQWLYELVLFRVDKGVGNVNTITELRRDPGTTREIVESKIFRDLTEIVF